LIGKSGTGKTYLVQSIQKILKFPLLILDATQLNPTGASGGIKAEDVNRLIINAAKSHMAQYPDMFYSLEGTIDQMVVFVDEIDKLGKNFNGSQGDWNKHVQSNFLTVFENIQIDKGSHKVSFIFAGAFTGLDSEAVTLNKEINIGFGAKPKNKNDNDKPKLHEMEDIDEAIIKFGLMPELVGRITAIAVLDSMSEDDFYDVLVNTLIPQKISTGDNYYHFNEDDINEDDKLRMAKKAYSGQQGVRSLKRSLDAHFMDLEFTYEERRVISTIDSTEIVMEDARAEFQLRKLLGLEGV
jgi:ATP-dependent Clp protease ATP-binding subunit ClpX